MTRWLARASLVAWFMLLANHTLSAAEIQLKKGDDRIEVTVGDKPFATYVFKSGAKPIIWPIIGPTGKAMTRDYPMKETTPDEAHDHIHHRSFWFTHGNVNGVSFWDEMPKSDKHPGHGTIVQREITKAEGGPVATIGAVNQWLGLNGKRVCTEERTIQFGAADDVRWIDGTFIIRATDGPVTFGDTKEGAFGIRVAEAIKVDAKKGGKLINAEGLADKDAWGKPSPWVDYHGPIDGERVGVAILNHPSSFRYPTHWHVRTYGLFAANPFGLHDFTGKKEVSGSHTIPAGESMTLRYRVLLHKGDENEGQVARHFADYAKAK